MVFGLSIAVMKVPLVSQWAETTSTAFGVGILFAMAAQPWLYAFSNIPFMGEPWPMNKTGIFVVAGRLSLKPLRLFSPAAAPTGIAIAFRNSFLFMPNDRCTSIKRQTPADRRLTVYDTYCFTNSPSAL